MSSLSSSLHNILSDGSNSLIIDCKMQFLTVAKYLSLLFDLSSTNFYSIVFLTSIKHLFLSVILVSLALLIILDFEMFKS